MAAADRIRFARNRENRPELYVQADSDCQKSRFAKNNAQKIFGRLLKKAVDSKGKAFGRVPPDAKSFAFIRIRKGDATARWAVASWETLSRGFPMRRLTPHLCNLLSANQFFDTLKPAGCSSGGFFVVCSGDTATEPGESGSGGRDDRKRGPWQAGEI